MYKKIKVVIGQLGSPKSTKVSDVRAYLKEFLADPRVVDINPLIWKIILNLFVLPFRPKKSAQAYSRIWDGNSFPLIENTKDFAHKVQKHLDKNIELNYCFLLSEPRPSTLLEEWEKEDFDQRADKVVILPQFPQYSESTVASVFDISTNALADRVNIPSIEFHTNYHKLKAFIDLSVKKIEDFYAKDAFTDLIISFHGIPLRRVSQKKDEYYFQCYETFLLIEKKLNLTGVKIHLCFQSRFGSEQWLGPATDEYAVELVKSGVKKVGCYCPSFVVDCLETTDEIGNELREDLEEHGADLNFIECLNDDDEWAQGYAHYINTICNGNMSEKKELFYELDAKETRQSLPEQKVKSPPMSPDAKKNIKLVFFTLFLDLLGFSIIFPIFPKLAQFYLTTDSDNVFLKSLFNFIDTINISSANSSVSNIVLFGGIVGALYSLLQFFAAPFWGRVSDRIGRRPVMLISILGLLISYIIWFFSGSFTLLLISRVLGGIMAGNLSVATAIVADVTTKEQRGKGMAYVGIAFALGFIFGPAIGGILSMIDLTDMMPHLAEYGINPFSVPAGFAAILCVLNLFLIFTKYKETFVPTNTTKRVSNPFKLLSYNAGGDVNKANFVYFIFIIIFSGMEFTLTFVALERLAYKPIDNAFMFVFIGFLIALIQGGYVRRKIAQVGEVSMALKGMILIIPGLVLLSYFSNGFLLYLSLFFLACGSAMVIPSLTGLVSLLSADDVQGENLGVFRSFGAMGRVIGPLGAALLYWKIGSVIPYLIFAALMLIPIIMIRKIKSATI